MIEPETIVLARRGKDWRSGKLHICGDDHMINSRHYKTLCGVYAPYQSAVQCDAIGELEALGYLCKRCQSKAGWR